MIDHILVVSKAEARELDEWVLGSSEAHSLSEHQSHWRDCELSSH